MSGDEVQAMAWWLIPITATLLAIAWVTWTARPRRPASPHNTLAAHRRFTEALSPPTPWTPDARQRPKGVEGTQGTQGTDPDFASEASAPEHRRSA